MLHGWLKLHRSLLSHWVASEPESLAVWIRLLAEANHKPSKKRFNGSLIDVDRGQTIFGLNAFSDKSGITKAKLRRILSELESDGMINRQITNKYSLITITCFDKYQGDDTQDASKKQPERKQAAIKSQHRKNDKNGEEEKENKEQCIEDAFDKFWGSYHKKQGKAQALKAFKTAVKREGIKDFEEFSDMLIADCKERLSAKQFGFDNLNGATYLNNNRWEDEKMQTSSQSQDERVSSIASEFGLYGWKG